MATERYDIEVTDKVDNNVAGKLRDIAKSATDGNAAVLKLKAALADINATPVQRLAAQSNAMSNALAREMTAQAKLTTARAQASVADAKAATEAQRLATATANTEAAQMRAAAAAARASTAQAQAAATAERLANATSSMTSRANALKSALDPAYGAQLRFNAEMAEAKTLLAAGAINMRTYQSAVEAATGKLNTFDTTLDTANKTMSKARNNSANLVAQFNDIGVSLAGGQNPLLVLIQQGSQISYIAGQMENGWKGVTAQALRMTAAFLPLIAVVGSLWLGFKGLSEEANNEAGLKKFINNLGLTQKEIKELKDTTITTTDTIKAGFTVLGQMILETMGITTDQIKGFFSSAADFIVNVMKYGFIGIGALVVALVKTIGKVVANIGIFFYNAGQAAKNLFLMGIETLVNQTIEGINKIGSVVNSISEAAGFGKVVGEFDKINLGVKGVTQGMADFMEVDFMGDFNKAANVANNNISQLTQRTKKLAEETKKADLTKQANKIKEDRPAGPKGAAPKESFESKQAFAIDMVNAKLDDELARMRELKDARAIQQRFDQIEQDLAQKKMKMNDAEAASVRAKITAIEAYKYVQSEMDRIHEESVGPLRTLNAVQAASNDLLARGAISAEEAAAAQFKANRAYQEATDPLFNLKEGMAQAEAASKLYGDAVARNNYLEQLRQAYLAKGIDITTTNSAAIKAEVDAMVSRNNALMEQQRIQSTIAGIVDPITQDQTMLANKQAYYDELQRLRDTDQLNEAAYQQAKYALDSKFNEMRLAGASAMFGELASLSSSGNKKLAAIGKAAAIAQATIDGFVAVQKALASAPPPWNFALAGAVALKTGVQVAGIASTNVGNFKDGGDFMVNGKAGVDANNISMNVSNGERVRIDTPAQQRAQENGGAAPVIQSNTKIINVYDKRELLSHMDSEEGTEIIMNAIASNPNRVNGSIGNGNS